MAYTKQTWATGDIITADKLNHMEGGIAAAGAFIVNIESGNGSHTADKTLAEMLAAYNAGAMVYCQYDGHLVAMTGKFSDGMEFGAVAPDEFSEQSGGSITIRYTFISFYEDTETGNDDITVNEAFNIISV